MKIIKTELGIDTTEYGKVIFSLTKNHPELVSGSELKIIEKSYSVIPQESSKILEYLNDFLKLSKIKKPREEIKKIIIYKKTSAGFTGLRIASAIAQALSLAWSVPIKVKSK